MAISDPKILDKGRTLVRTLRREGRRDEAQTVDALLQAVEAAPRGGNPLGAPTPFLTTGEVAQRVGVSRQTVVNWVKKGLLDGVRLGGRTLIAPAALERFAQLEGILGNLDAERKPATPTEAAEAVTQTRKGRTWRQQDR
ncbi:MAG TPA: helix-turn-helix domain-containing protein [Anaerolineales bacterium]